MQRAEAVTGVGNRGRNRDEYARLNECFALETRNRVDVIVDSDDGRRRRAALLSYQEDAKREQASNLLGTSSPC
jgi:hypothetical protein